MINIRDYRETHKANITSGFYVISQLLLLFYSLLPRLWVHWLLLIWVQFLCCCLLSQLWGSLRNIGETLNIYTETGDGFQSSSFLMGTWRQRVAALSFAGYVTLSLKSFQQFFPWKPEVLKVAHSDSVENGFSVLSWVQIEKCTRNRKSSVGLLKVPLTQFKIATSSKLLCGVSSCLALLYSGDWTEDICSVFPKPL